MKSYKISLMNLLTKAYIFNFLTIDDKIQNFENFKLQNNFQVFDRIFKICKYKYL